MPAPRHRARTVVGDGRRAARPPPGSRRRRAPGTPGRSGGGPARGRGTVGRRLARSASACSAAARTAPGAVIHTPSRRSPSSRPTPWAGWRPAAVEGGVQEVAGAVAGEHPTGAVRAVRGGREADDHEVARPGRRTRARAGPSSRRRGTPPASLPDLLPPGDQPRAGSAADDLGLEPVERPASSRRSPRAGRIRRRRWVHGPCTTVGAGQARGSLVVAGLALGAARPGDDHPVGSRVGVRRALGETSARAPRRIAGPNARSAPHTAVNTSRSPLDHGKSNRRRTMSGRPP